MSAGAACEGRAAPVGEAQPEHVVAVEPQGLHRAQQHHVAHVELHQPHVLALKQHRLLDVLAHHLQHSTGTAQVKCKCHCTSVTQGSPACISAFPQEGAQIDNHCFCSHSDYRVWKHGGQDFLIFKNHRFLTLATSLFCNNCEAIPCAFLYLRKHVQSTCHHKWCWRSSSAHTQWGTGGCCRLPVKSSIIHLLLARVVLCATEQ